MDSENSKGKGKAKAKEKKKGGKKAASSSASSSAESGETSSGGEGIFYIDEKTYILIKIRFLKCFIPFPPHLPF